MWRNPRLERILGAAIIIFSIVGFFVSSENDSVILLVIMVSLGIIIILESFIDLI